MPRNKFGWVPDLPDVRDFKFSELEVPTKPLPAKVDLRDTCSPIEDQGILGSCHDAETDVLTSEGWRRFDDLDGTEKLATVNPATQELFFETPKRIIRLPYKGE